MSLRAEADRKFRRAIWGGLVVSVALHGALLAFGRLSIPEIGGENHTATLVSLPDDMDLDSPLEVVQIKPVEEVSAKSRAASAVAAALAKLPRLTASISAALPSPTVFMQAVAVPDQEEARAITYASASEFLTRSRPNSRELRSIDSRSVAVLAALSVARGGGGGFSGGHCPSGGIGLF